MRPGFGDPTDSWRIESAQGLYQQNIQFQNHQGWTDWWVFWRRVAGGSTQEQQETILADIAKGHLHPGAMKNPKRLKDAIRQWLWSHGEIGSITWATWSGRQGSISDLVLKQRINHNQFEQAHWWALGRLASRILYGSQHSVIPREQAEQWLPKLLDQNWQKEQMIAFAAVMICRKTGDRQFDISDDYRAQVLEN